MNIKFIAVGKVKDPRFAAKIEDYAKRLQRFAKVTLIDVKDSTPEKEAKALCALLAKEHAYKFALSEEGRQYTSIQFADELSALQRDMLFVVGGPEGLSAEVKQAADCILSLSPMTFVHEMAKMFLIEQVYRAFTICAQGKYHK